ncbi:MAG: AIR synthase-related protein, partial [Pyrinomonadaceae bacterium]
INRGTWPELPIFGLMQRLGNVDEKEMFRTFNMGIGMVVICSESERERVKGHLGNCYEIGLIIGGENGVSIQ